MKLPERRPGEGRVEYLLRLNTIENLGMCAVLAAGAVLIPPAAGVLAAGAAIEGVGAIGSHLIQQRMKEKRLRKAQGTDKSGPGQ